MDGLSVAASIVGVISLAMQLSQTTRKLIAFLDTINEAPSEIARLHDLLKLIFAMAAGVVNALEHQRSRRGDMFPGHDHLRDVLVVCLERVTFVHDLVDKIETPKSGRNFALKGWAKFTLAMKKDEILELERQLGQALSVLNIMLTTSLLYYQPSGFSPASAPPVLGNSQTYSDEDMKTESTESHHHTLPTRGPGSLTSLDSQSAIVSKSSRSCHWGEVIALSSERRSRRRYYLCGNSMQLQTERFNQVFKVVPGFLSKSIELAFHRVGGQSLSVSLHIRQTIPYEYFLKNVMPVIRRDDVSGFQSLISGGVCTINTLAFSDTPIVLIAELLRSTKIANFLHSQGCEFSTALAPHTLSIDVNYGLHQSPFRSITPNLDLVEYDPFDIVPHRDEPGWVGKGAAVLDAIQWLVESGYQRTSLPPQEYFGSLLCITGAWWERMDARDLKEHRNAMAAKIILSGANLHYMDRSGRTALLCLVRYSTPGEEPYAVAEWLRILRDCRINDSQYFAEECRLFPDSFDSWAQLFFLNRQKHYIFHRPRRLSMEILDTDTHDMKSSSLLWIYPKSSASQVLHEFPFLPDIRIGASSICWTMGYWLDLWKQNAYCAPADRTTIRQRLEQWMLENLTQRSRAKWDALKQGEISREDEKSLNSALEEGDMEWASILISEGNICRCDSSGEFLDLWPFSGKTHTLCGTGNFSGRPCLKLKDDWCVVHCCMFNHERFARKQEKKRLKQVRMMGLKTRFYVPPVPGRWVD